MEQITIRTVATARKINKSELLNVITEFPSSDTRIIAVTIVHIIDFLKKPNLRAMMLIKFAIKPSIMLSSKISTTFPMSIGLVISPYFQLNQSIKELLYLKSLTQQM